MLPPKKGTGLKVTKLTNIYIRGVFDLCLMESQLIMEMLTCRS